MPSSDGYEALISAVLCKGFPFYGCCGLQRSADPAEVSGVDDTELDNGQPVRSRWRQRDRGRRTSSYSCGTEKDGAQRSKESTVVGRKMRRD
jgi:hypothetical protein